MCKYISSSNKLCVTQLTQWKLATKSAEKLQTRKVWLVTGFNFNQSFKLNIMFTHKEVRTTGSESSSLLWLFCSAVWIWLTCDSGWTAVMLSGEGGAWLLVWSHSGQGRKSTHTHTHTHTQHRGSARHAALDQAPEKWCRVRNTLHFLIAAHCVYSVFILSIEHT